MRASVPFRLLGSSVAFVVIACEAPSTSDTAEEAGVAPSREAGSSATGVSDGGTTDSTVADAAVGDGAPEVDAAPCDVSLCLTGAKTRAEPSNATFNAMCESGKFPGIVKSCTGSTCFATFETFLVNVQSVIYPKLFAALDTNADGKVDNRDHACKVNILGYSWGGVAANEVAKALLADSNVAVSRRSVQRLVVIDPYQPAMTGLQVPAGVEVFRGFRHSIAPATDCSKGELFGPYLGLRPHCAAGMNCIDYDYSLNPYLHFQVLGGGLLQGSAVGHCDVAKVAALPIYALFAGDPVPVVPDTVPITP